MGVGYQVYKKLFGGRLGQQYSEQEIEVHKKQFSKSLKVMDTWLSKTKFLCGDEISIADLSAACELHNINFLDVQYKEFSNVTRWMSEMMRIPEMAEVNELVNSTIVKLKKMRAKL